jgi:hypothetical protein
MNFTAASMRPSTSSASFVIGDAPCRRSLQRLMPMPGTLKSST